MDIVKKKEGTKLIVEVKGRIDTLTSKELEKALVDEIPTLKDISFDLSQVDYISSAGLRLFLVYSKALGGKEHIVISGANAVIKEIFGATAFSNFATIE